ncbi:transposable element Tcb1 transposase [Trichonephila clavipes]|uniref:Transposable element Tcb1 transposase n=1 Tax=Trichonephila clavipes TaxID=2585209 RepID=A0A8X6RTM0_TRICX|nr:transposable element Tcb1 transposase [Trichonephila clavipes]
MPCRRHRASLDQVFDFKRGEKVEDLSSLDAGGNGGPGCRSHPPCGTTACDDRRMEVMDPAATSRNIFKQIQSVTHHLVSTRTIRRHSQQSRIYERRLFLHLLLTGNHRHLRHQRCDERQTSERSLIMFTEGPHFDLQGHDGQIRVWRHRSERLLNCCVMNRPTRPDPVSWFEVVFDRTSQVRHAGTLKCQPYISEVLKPVLPYIQRLLSTLFQHYNARPHVERTV